MIAAHKTLPFGAGCAFTISTTAAMSTSPSSIAGPSPAPSRIIDLSTVAANALGIRSVGIAHVRVERL